MVGVAQRNRDAVQRLGLAAHGSARTLGSVFRVAGLWLAHQIVKQLTPRAQLHQQNTRHTREHRHTGSAHPGKFCALWVMLICAVLL